MPLWYQNVRSAVALLQSVFGVLIFCYALKRRRWFWLRALTGLLAGGLLLYGLQRFVYIPGTTLLAMVTHAVMPACVYLALIGVIYFSCDETIWTALFAASSGYIAQDIGGAAKQLLTQIPLMQLAAQDAFGVLGVDLLCYGGVYLILFRAFQPYTRSRTDSFDDKLKAIISVVVLLICIGMARLTQDNPNRGLMPAIADAMYRVIVGVLMLALQFGVMEQAKLKNNVEVMRELMHQQRMQYESHKDTVQLINEKYHDLKNMVRSMQWHIPQDKLRSLEQSIDRYDLHVDSGNGVLDVLLTEKMDVCLQRGISLTCSLGQTDFSFIDELDLYGLFQNALNNAINAVSALPEGRERFIILSASRVGNMLTIHTENPCEGEIDFEDGLPQSEGDPHYHGFGMKSMVRTAEKYGGILAAKQEEDMFYLDILLLA